MTLYPQKQIIGKISQKQRVAAYRYSLLLHKKELLYQQGFGKLFHCRNILCFHS